MEFSKKLKYNVSVFCALDAEHGSRSALRHWFYCKYVLGTVFNGTKTDIVDLDLILQQCETVVRVVQFELLYGSVLWVHNLSSNNFEVNFSNFENFYFNTYAWKKNHMFFKFKGKLGGGIITNWGVFGEKYNRGRSFLYALFSGCFFEKTTFKKKFFSFKCENSTNGGCFVAVHAPSLLVTFGSSFDVVPVLAGAVEMGIPTVVFSWENRVKKNGAEATYFVYVNCRSPLVVHLLLRIFFVNIRFNDL